MRRSSLLLFALLILAFLVRLPFLGTIPRFTDESLEVTWSLQIVRGEGFPLTNYDAYYGALFNYLVAGIFALFGPDALAARALSLAVGVLTVAVTCLLGRAWGGARAGLLAGLFLTVNGAHIAINSHIAWSNCLTPVFTTAAVWALWRGATAPRWLVLAGLLFGLAVQTHPLVVLLLPGAAVFVAWRAPRTLRTPWPYLAALTFLMGYGNMLLHNVSTGFESIITASRIKQQYTQDADASPGYLTGLAAELLLLGRMLAGAVDSRPAPWGFLLDPLLWAASGLAIAGVVCQARRGNWLPLLLSVSFLLLLPAANPKFRTLVTSRYVMPILPILLAALAGPAVDVLVGVRNRFLPGSKRATGSETSAARARGAVWRVLAAVTAVAMVLVPPVLLSRYYARAIEQADTNDRAMSFAEQIAQVRKPGETVVLDESFGSENGAGVSELRALSYLLTLRDIPVKDYKLTAKRLEDELDDEPGVITILTGRQYRDMDRLPLQLLGPPPDRPGAYALYRFERSS